MPDADDVLDHEELGDVDVWARPLAPSPVQRGVITVRHEYAERPVASAPVVAPEPSRAVPWALIVVALVILVVACYAAWHTYLGPQLVPVKPGNSVDLVGPSRGDSR